MCCNDILSVLTHLVCKYIYAIAHCVLILFLIISMILVAILGLPKVNIYLYLIIFFLTIILAILGGIFICYSGRDDPETKKKTNGLINFALILTIILLILTIVEEVIIFGDLSDKKDDEEKNCFDITTDDADTSSIVGDLYDCAKYYFIIRVKDYTIFKLTYIEIISIISIVFWLENKKKNNEEPIPQTNIPLNPGTTSSYDINRAPNNIYMVKPGIPAQQYNSNYYPPQQQSVVYMYNQAPNNNNYQGQQYVVPNNNNYQGQPYIVPNNNNYQGQQYVVQNNNNIGQNNININSTSN